MFSETIELRGHIIDSLILPKVLDQILTHGAHFKIGEITIGQKRADQSFARIEVSGEAHGFDLKWNDQPAAGFAVLLGPGENALAVAAAVKERMAQLQPSFPKGVEWFSPYDTSDFVRISVDEVIKTLAEAMVLVFLVMLLFLQNLRATLIPTLVIPVGATYPLPPPPPRQFPLAAPP